MLSFEIILLLSGLSLAALSIYLLISTVFASNADADLLAWSDESRPSQSDSPLINFSRPLIHNFTLQMTPWVRSGSYRRNIESKILTAGLNRELNVDEFIGMQFLWGGLFPVVLVILNFALQLGYSYWLCLAIGIVGAYFPHLHCQRKKNERYVAVISQLPFFIDLLALSTEAGKDFTGAIQDIVEKVGSGTLSEELQIVLKDIKLGSSRADALKKLSQRLDIPEMTSFVSVLVDADQTGTSISKVLKDQSEQMRLERLMRAEKAGAQASQKMLIPLMMFILPAVFVMVFAPVVLQFFYGD